MPVNEIVLDKWHYILPEERPDQGDKTLVIIPKQFVRNPKNPADSTPFVQCVNAADLPPNPCIMAVPEFLKKARRFPNSE
jgi:hypothetical protein